MTSPMRRLNIACALPIWGRKLGVGQQGDTMNRWAIAAFGAALACSSCASVYKNTNTENSAVLSISMDSDSDGTMVRDVFSWAFKDESCAGNPNGTRLGATKFGNQSTKETTPIVIAADKAFTFTTVYMESRFRPQLRQCALMAVFEPKSGRKYRAQIVSRDQVSSCSLGIYDVTDPTPRQIEFKMPEKACMFHGAAAENGRPLWTDYRIQYHSAP